MRAATKITFYDDEGQKFFGEGPCQLLRGIEETGSLRAAALSMEMAYSKAMRLLKNAEKACPKKYTFWNENARRNIYGNCGGNQI